jgi:hypothetical protein
MQLDEKTRTELRDKYGSGAKLLHADGHDYVFRRATVPEYSRFKAAALNEKERPNAGASLLSACRLFPPADEYSRLISERPALPEQLGLKFVQWLGDEIIVEVEEL